MPSFDFLDDPNRPDAVEVQPPRYRTWGWSTGHEALDERRSTLEYSLACLTDDSLYVKVGYKNLRDRVAAISELNAFEPPAVFEQAYQRFPLSAIYRLRYCDHIGTLDLVNFDGSYGTIVDGKTKQTRSIFETLHKLLAPAVPITEEDVPGFNNIKGPLAVLGSVCLFAGIFIAWPFIDDGRNGNNTGRRAIIADVIDAIVYGLGPTTTTVIASLFIVAAFGYVVHRYLNPLQAQAVVIKR